MSSPCWIWNQIISNPNWWQGICTGWTPAPKHVILTKTEAVSKTSTMSGRKPCLKYFTCLRTAHRNCMQHNSAHQPSQEQQRYLLLVSLTTPTKKETPGMTTCKPFYLTRNLLWISEISRVGNWRGTGGCLPKTKTNTQRGKTRNWRQT